MATFEEQGTFYLGKLYDAEEGKIENKPFLYKSKDLTTHAICVGMTGSGKTGLGITILEEAALDSIPSIVIDPKGDMGNILLAFPHLSPDEFKPWIDQGEAERKGKTLDVYAEEVAKIWQEGLEASGETVKRVQDFRNAVSMEIYTPASRAGIPLSILSSFQAPSEEFILDTDAMREKVLSTTSSILGLLGIDADPIKSREHILIATIINQSWKERRDIDLAELIQLVQHPPFSKIGVLDLDLFFPPKDRKVLSVNLNNLLAAPGFQAWMEGAPLDIQQLLYTSELKPKISVISIAHLNDAERMFFVTLFLNQLIGWARKQPGTSSLRALFYMDEIFGYFPPIATPPSKTPMITLLKQARAFGLGMVLCTQNPVDLDYKGLSNCGTWFIGRLQTARDKLRVTEGLISASNGDIDSSAMDHLMSKIESRVFIMRSIYYKEPVLFQTRWAFSYLRGPLTLAQIGILTKDHKKDFKNTISTIAGTIEDKQSIKPFIPTGVSEYFFHSPQSFSPVVYRPFLAGFAKLHFIDKKYNVDDWLSFCLLVEVTEEGKGLQWERAENFPDLRQQLVNFPDKNATYQQISPQIFEQKNELDLKKKLLDCLYQNNTLKLFEFKELNLFSTPQETEADFRHRVTLALREERDKLLEKLRDQNAKKLVVLKEKIRKAEEKKNTQQFQSFYQKFEAFLSMMTTIIGVFIGKKVSKTTINQAGTTFRRAGRVGKESQDVTNAEENLQILQQQEREIEAELKEEISKISTQRDPSTLSFNELVIRPRKGDITIEELALIWRS